MFISFEGTEGSGKSTQIKLLADVFRTQYPSRSILLTREPGGTDISDQIRTILLDNLENKNMQPRAELLLFCASRAQLVGELIRPQLESGGIVLCDRYSDSTLAYQGYGHGLNILQLKQVLAFATLGLQPNLTIYLDLDPAEGLRRRTQNRDCGGDWNRIDAMTLAFHQRVYRGYQSIIAKSSERFIVIDAQASIDGVHNSICAALFENSQRLQHAENDDTIAS